MNDSNSIFVHRDTELDMARERLSALRAGKPVSEPVLFFHGIAKVGKSTLLRKIKQLSIQNLIPSALIDFGEGLSGELGGERLLREIMKQWRGTTDVGPFKPLTSQDNLENVASKLVAYVIQLHSSARSTPVTLLLDTLEVAERETFSWLQERVLAPVLEGGKAFIVMAARGEYFELPIELTWPVSRRTRFLAMSGFAPKETQDHYHALLGDASPTLWQRRLLEDPNWLTLGVPGLNEIAFHRSFETDEAAEQYMVEEVIFKHIAEGGVREIQDLLLTMAAFRKFDYRLLANTANHFWPDRYPEGSRAAGVKLARHLKTTMLLEARRDGYGHVISPGLRSLLDDYQRYRQNKQHFQTHCLAYRWFQQEVEKGDFVSVTDQLYHLAGAWFDWDQANGKGFEYPDGLPSPLLPTNKSRSSVLSEIIDNGLRHLGDKSKADTQVEKVLNAFQQEQQDFRKFLSKNEISALIDYSQKCLDRAIQIADGQDEKS